MMSVYESVYDSFFLEKISFSATTGWSTSRSGQISGKTTKITFIPISQKFALIRYVCQVNGKTFSFLIFLQKMQIISSLEIYI
jgi:hypothetical protein